MAGGEDLFVHQTAIIADGFRSLREGEAVEFFIENSEDGRSKAVQVTGPNGAQPQVRRRRVMARGLMHERARLVGPCNTNVLLSSVAKIHHRHPTM